MRKLIQLKLIQTAFTQKLVSEGRREFFYRVGGGGGGDSGGG